VNSEDHNISIAKSGTRWLPRVTIIGAFPPPIGGNSVHIARLYGLLKANGYSI